MANVRHNYVRFTQRWEDAVDMLISILGVDEMLISDAEWSKLADQADEIASANPITP